MATGGAKAMKKYLSIRHRFLHFLEPVYLLAESPTGDVPPIKWEFDYPDEGPTDIYAMGVPRGTEIDDQMPS